ncbi:TusE/DsrC/DsvC family sulfur relay protein [Thiosocius teredinicola]|uniref:TusE/DsrC/DsvC family sulfur relay protein n=1 Tax=Thiosocius teredinicola TaxID=1973002 RepID=UPI000F76E05F
MSSGAGGAMADDVYAIEADGRVIATDLLGYLLDPSEWNPTVGVALAQREGITLGPDHWTMIEFVRDWYEDRQAVPEARWLLKGMKQQLGEDKGTRKYLHKLFPHGYGPELCKIAGMTMPRKVMLDV